MMNRLRALGYGVARALSGARRVPMQTAAVIGAVAVSLALVGLVLLVARNVDHMTSGWGGAGMVVYLDDGVTPDRVAEIQAALDRLPAVEKQAYIPSEHALQRLRAALGDRGELIEDIEPGMLPASIEVTLARGVRDVARIHPVVDRLRASSGIEEVEVSGEWIERLSVFAEKLRYAGWVLFFLVSLGCVYLITACFGVRAPTRRDEIEVLQLLGASRTYVRGPIVLEGAVHGAVGAALATVGLWALFRHSADGIHRLLYDTLSTPGHVVDMTPAFLPTGHWMLLVAVGAALGAVGSGLGIGRRHAVA